MNRHKPMYRWYVAAEDIPAGQPVRLVEDCTRRVRCASPFDYFFAVGMATMPIPAEHGGYVQVYGPFRTVGR